MFQKKGEAAAAAAYLREGVCQQDCRQHVLGVFQIGILAARHGQEARLNVCNTERVHTLRERLLCVRGSRRHLPAVHCIQLPGCRVDQIDWGLRRKVGSFSRG